MADAPIVLATHRLLPRLDGDTVLNALASAVIVIDGNDNIVHVNGTAEQLLGGSASVLIGQPLVAHVPADSPASTLISQVRARGNAVNEYDVTLETPRIGKHLVNLQATPLPEAEGHVVLALQHRSIAEKIDRQLTHRGAARSVTAMAAMLAHEVKNPLSSIRGAAQLLEQEASEQDAMLTRLIRDEADRICDLVDRMEAFGESPPMERAPVNIHLVLDRVQRLAETGFGRHVRFVADFDPSLPAVHGNHDQLVQVFLNIVKNACEAVPDIGGEVVLATGYQRGVRLAVPGRDTRVHLPLQVRVRDNGPGIPDDILTYLFDPFVTSKPGGSGLGLALVAKIVGDHGGVIECDSTPKRTEFRVMLPVHAAESDA